MTELRPVIEPVEIPALEAGRWVAGVSTGSTNDGST